MCVEIKSQVSDTDSAVLAELNAGNTDGFFRYLHSRCNAFSPSGEKLKDLQTIRENMERSFASGQKVSFQLKDSNVEVYGLTTGLVTGILVGTVTAPDGAISDVQVRYTGVYVKENDSWKQVHWHESPLASDI